MNALRKGLLLGALQVALVASLGAKLAWDRHRLPRAWAKAATYDPNLPIRGRYLALQLEVVCDDPGAPSMKASALSRDTSSLRAAGSFFLFT